MTEPMVSIENLSLSYRERRKKHQVLNGITLTVQKGEWVMITGESGAGKSTLLHVIAGLLPPSAGKIRIDGREYTTENERAQFRNKQIGVMFQGSPLLPTFLVWENVALPSRISAGNRSRFTPEERMRAIELLDQLGMREHSERYPHQLSLGQKRRVAIARALMNRPTLLLADEPTNDLDPIRVESLLSYFQKIHQQGMTIIMVTHQERPLQYGDRRIRLENGTLKEE
ncbi:ABC transporter related protein [[Clostridium] ultunense Esp]|uniref:ABC transporter ATP-binding protein n=1 Tax=Thermicanus aegyptius TaxID=94009 RepID=UPI0002B6FB26|nr:ABC transporter ATP-binding protein [Thermicanus aegyptius]CCQ93442.1 ABC transporter related protein [[Clostridium] ultunense Esp]